MSAMVEKDAVNNLFNQELRVKQKVSTLYSAML